MPSDAFALLHAFALATLGEDNVQTNKAQTAIRVHKPAGGKSVTGTFLIRASDTHAAEGQSLVSMRREKVSVEQMQRARTRGRAVLVRRSEPLREAQK